jgi:hypothetical protein
MNIIGCLDTPTSGEYFLNGPNVAQLSDSELAAIRNKEIGFVFQTFNLLPRLTALQNVALPLVYAGIPEAERDLVFQPFYRALGTDADGSGLGLPIVMEIAHQHAAIVTLEDAYPGKPMPGARFSVRFSNTQA